MVLFVVDDLVPLDVLLHVLLAHAPVKLVVIFVEEANLTLWDATAGVRRELEALLMQFLTAALDSMLSPLLMVKAPPAETGSRTGVFGYGCRWLVVAIVAAGPSHRGLRGLKLN